MSTLFNEKSRTENAVRASLISTVCRIINLGMGFAYRTLFLHILSTAYLGINGLFSGILQVLSFAELGIGVAISYRLYEPISRNDSRQVGKLMVFYRRVYLVVGTVVLTVGLCILPFLKYLIKDTADIPSDINLYLVYVLFLLQSAASYVCVTPQMLLSADQKQYQVSAFQSLVTLANYALQIAVLFVTENYTLTLACGICLNLFCNIILSVIIRRKYKEVYTQTGDITSGEKKAIFRDTGAMMCHKLAGMVLVSTDSIVLTKFVGLIANGLYSNYSLILSSLQGLLTQLLSSFTASIGNAHVNQSPEERYTAFHRLLFLNMWIAGMCTVCIFILIDDFISVWIGPDNLLGSFVTIVVCVQFFVETIRLIVTSYVSASGLFKMDKLRAITEALLNIIVSVVLVKRIGMAGVFIGTIISHLCTVTWREPLILYKYDFGRSTADYWKCFSSFAVLTLSLCVLLFYGKIFINYTCSGFLSWIVEAVICVLIYNAAALLIFRRTADMKFYLDFFFQKVKS